MGKVWDNAKHPINHRTSPATKNYISPMSTVLSLRSQKVPTTLVMFLTKSLTLLVTDLPEFVALALKW